MLTLTTHARAGRRTREESHAMVQTLVAIGLLCLTTLALLAAPVPTGKPGNYPAWWFSRNVIAQKNPTNASPTWPTNYPTSDDYAGINQGQLKNLATAAYNELRAQAPTNVWTTPQGANLTAMVTGWNPASGDAYAGVNLGQLKTVAKPFYDLLMQIGYTGAYPWTGVNADDYAAANIGQAKYAFSFDVTAAPLAVTGLTVTAAVNELDLAWTDPPYNPMENLTVLQSTDGGSTWTAIATLSPGTTSFAAPNLDPNLSYSYKISSNRNTSGGSASTASTTPAPPISLPRYALIDLGTNMYPVAMNSNCDVVGGTNLWSQGTNYNLSGGSFTGVVWASGIDDSGHMVGNNGSGAGGNPQVVYWASKTSAPSGLGTNMVWPGSDGSYPFGGISLNGCMGGDGSIVGEMDAAGASIIATFTNGGSPAYFWSPGGTNGAYGYFARPASKARGHWAGWYLDGFSSTSGAVVDGTEYPGKTAYAVNDSGVAVGTDTPYAPGNAIIFGSTPTVLGPGTALALNNATVMSGTNTVAQPQIVGYDASGNPILWDHTNPDGTTSSTYVGKKINSLCPTHSGWTVNYAAAINNSGSICGNANYSGTNSAIPQGQHGILLLPLSFVRETTPGSGDFEPIKDNGLDDKAQLPTFHPDMATTLNKDESYSGGYVFTVQLSQNLSSTSMASMTVVFYNFAGTFSGTVTETTAGSGIFKNSANTITITLSPITQTTSNTVADKVQVQVTDSALGLSNAPFTLGETGLATLNFTAELVLAEVDLSGPLSTTAVDTIVAHLSGSQDSKAVDATLTETGVNTKIFTRSLGDMTVAINSLSGTAMQISVQDNFLQAQTATLALTETSSTSNVFANVTATPTTFTALDPGSSGQGVFYIQVKGFNSTVPITISSGANSVIVNATPVSGSPGTIRTPPIALLAPGTSGTYSGITTLQIDGTANSVCASMFGSKLDPKTTGGAFIGRAISAFNTPVSHDPNESDLQNILDDLDGAAADKHLNTIEQTLINKLGWTVTKDQVVTYADLTSAISKYSIFYILAHGATPSGDASTNFGGFSVWPNYLDISLHPLVGTTVVPSNIQAHIGTANYKLVFLNGCSSADDTSSGGVPMAFAAAFKNASAQPDPTKAEDTAYVGWSTEANMYVAANTGIDFFNDMSSAEAGVAPTAKNAVDLINANLDSEGPSGFNNGEARLVCPTGQTQTIDLTPMPPTGP